ncbi:MAG: PEP-CTERM sorting domain-containing protein [Methylophilus sp.]|nr:PEP-CTERM sorting domain-containing protein [Methylophilus sp.]
MNTNKLLWKHVVVSSTLAMLFAGNAMAVTNGSFSDGLNGWSALGDVNLQAGAILMTTASVDFEDDYPESAGAFNASGTAAAETGVVGGIEDFIGVAMGTLNVGENFAFEGSVLKQTFNVNAGDTLTFNWNFFTNEASTGADYAFVSINGALTTLATPLDAVNSSLPYAYTTGFQTFSQTFNTASSVTLAFGVVDVNDYNVTSALWFDNVAVVPEPETYAMLLAGLGLLGFASRRKQA